MSTMADVINKYSDALAEVRKLHTALAQHCLNHPEALNPDDLAKVQAIAEELRQLGAAEAELYRSMETILPAFKLMRTHIGSLTKDGFRDVESIKKFQAFVVAVGRLVKTLRVDDSR